MAWKIELEYVKDWLNEQDVETQLGIYAALEVLAQQGPALGRPLVDTPSHTKVKNLKELRPATSEGSEVRMLFAFDPRRKAIVLVAGDKARGETRAPEVGRLAQKGHPSSREALHGPSEPSWRIA